MDTKTERILKIHEEVLLDLSTYISSLEARVMKLELDGIRLRAESALSDNGSYEENGNTVCFKCMEY